MALAVMGMAEITAGLAAPLQLGVRTLAGAAIYAGTLGLLWPHILKETWEMVRKKRPATPPAELKA